MKKILRAFVINLAAVIVISQIISGFKISEGYEGIILTSAVLTGVNFGIKPLIKLLLLPINLLTLGAFRWLTNVFSLYLVTLIVPHLSVVGYDFPGFVYQGFVIPEMYLAKIWVLVISSFLISLLTTFFFWLFK